MALLRWQATGPRHSLDCFGPRSEEEAGARSWPNRSPTKDDAASSRGTPTKESTLTEGALAEHDARGKSKGKEEDDDDDSEPEDWLAVDATKLKGDRIQKLKAALKEHCHSLADKSKKMQFSIGGFHSSQMIDVCRHTNSRGKHLH